MQLARGHCHYSSQQPPFVSNSNACAASIQVRWCETRCATRRHLNTKKIGASNKIRILHLRRQHCRIGASVLDEEDLLEEAPSDWPILTVGQSGLRRTAKKVPDDMLGGGELIEIVADMLDFMRQASCIGLAAPQLGILLQIIVLEDRKEFLDDLPPGEANRLDREPFGPITLINPKLMPVGRSGARHFEGCLSVPGCTAMVERYTVVDVEAVSPMGDPLRMRASGWQARMLQHAVDHLQGTLFIDRMLPRSFSMQESPRDTPRDVPPEGPCRCRHNL